MINWVAEIETQRHDRQDCNKAGRLEDIIGAFGARRTRATPTAPPMMNAYKKVAGYDRASQEARR